MSNEKEQPLVNEDSGSFNEPNEQSPRQPWTFSILGLLILTTVVALFIAVVPLLGAAVIPLFGFGLLIVVGVLAHGNNSALAFWAATGGFLMLFPLLSTLGLYVPRDSEVIAGCLIFGIGIYLAYYSIRHGHWATVVLGVLVISPYLFYLCAAVLQGLENWQDIVAYWAEG